MQNHTVAPDIKCVADNKNGFTLIELSISLVIISLIIGGVLVGKDLIEAAKIRATASQIQRYSTALNTFKLKYNALPGDIKNAIQMGITQDTNGNYVLCAYNSNSNYRNGNGNGNLEDGNHSGIIYHNYEFAMFWGHLQGAGFINDMTTTYGVTEACAPNLSAGRDYPFSKGVGETIDAVTDNQRPYFILGGLTKERSETIISYSFAACMPARTRCIAGQLLTPADAMRMDILMDDGNPTTGNMYAVQEYQGTSTGVLIMDVAAGATNCIAADGTYNLATVAKSCTLAIKAQ